jgi:hypothetical protein
VPDLQSELQKLEIISFDDEGQTTTTEEAMPKQTFKPTNNVSRATFSFIKENPGCTRTFLANKLQEQGYNKSSVVSLATQFLRQGMIRSTHGSLYVTQAEYTPVKASKTFKHKKPVAKVTDKQVEVPIIEATAQVAQPIVQHDTLVKAMLSRMSILQAREMYDELKKIFNN